MTTPKFLQKHSEYLDRYGFLGTSPVDCPDFLVPLAKEQERYGVGGGGGDAYAASAVHFDGSTWLSCASGTCTNNSFFSSSCWFNFVSVGGANRSWFLVDPHGNYTPQFNFVINPPNEEAGFNLYTPDFSQGMQMGNQFGRLSGNWRHVIMSADINLQTGQIYVDDVPQSGLDPDFFNLLGTTPGGVFSVNGLQWVFGGDDFPEFPQDQYIGDVADAWIAPGVSLLDGTGLAIPEVTRRLFISAGGKPVNPSGWPASAVQFYGDATAFATNHGSGGTFTVASGALTNASTSPSD